MLHKVKVRFGIVLWHERCSWSRFILLKDLAVIYVSFPGGSVVKNSPANVGDMGLIPWSGRFPGEGNDNPLQYSCLGNPMVRGAWWAKVHGVTKESDMT